MDLIRSDTLRHARQEYEQASRNLRRLHEERRHRSSVSLDALCVRAVERQRRAASELERLEAIEATRPDGAETRQQTTPSQP